jgi:iron complex outermembrane recepter protein
MSLVAMLGLALPAAQAEDWSQRLRQLESGAVPNFDPAGLQLAQTGTVRFDIPAQPLQDALASFGRQSGWQLSYPADVTEGLTSQPIAGAYRPEDALGQLLAGTGVTWRTVGDRTIVLERPPGESGVITLNPVTVEGRAPGESAYGPVEGYVARQSATGSKTDTPLIETPRSVSVITADQLEAQQVQDIRQALRYSAGVVAEARGADYSQPSMIIRGFQSFDPLYLDGMKGHGRNFLTYASTPLDPYAFERVEVLRGPASVLYGQGQPGGLINQVSKRPTEEFFAELGGLAGNDDTFGGKLDIGGPLDDEKELLLRLTASGRDGDNQVDTLEDSRVFVAPAFTWAPTEDTTLTLLAHYQKDDTNGAQIVPADALDNDFGDISTSTLLSEPGFEKYHTEQFAVGYLFDHRFDDTFQLHHRLRYNDFEVDYRSLYSVGFQPDSPLLNRAIFTSQEEGYYLSTDSNVQADFDLGPMKHTVLLGVDYKLASVDVVMAYPPVDLPIDPFDPDYGADIPGFAPSSDTSEHADQVGIYLQDQVKLFDKLVLTLGGRQDWAKSDVEDNLGGGDKVRQNDDDFTWQAGLVYLFDNGLAPYASYAESFEPQSGTDVQGQPFKPTTGQQYEVGVKFQPNGYESFITLSAYQLTRQNILTPDPDPLNAGFSVQTGEARSRGIEVEAKASLAENFDLTAAYTFTNAEITKSNGTDEGNQLDSVPKHAASLWADYTIDEGALDGFGLGAGVRYIGETTDSTNTVTVEDVALFDAAIHYEWNSFRFALNANNLTDETYISSCFSPTFCYFGQRRTVLGSVTYRW